MKTAIESIHFNLDTKLKNLILEKTSSLTKIFEAIESCKVILELKNDDKNQNKVVEISISVPQDRLFSKNKSETFEMALELAVNELKQQLKKYKAKKIKSDEYATALEMLE